MSDETIVQQTEVTGKCERCGVDIPPAPTEGQFKRNLGLHMHNAHGIPGKWREKRLRQAENRMRREAEMKAGTFGMPTESMPSKGSAEQRRAWALNAVKARWAKTKREEQVTDGMADTQLAADMTVRQSMQLTPEQKRRRATLRKAKWWRERYRAEKNGTAPLSTVTKNVKSLAVVPAGRRPLVPAEFQNQFTREELQLLKEMSVDEAKALKRTNPQAYKKRNSLKSRLHYYNNRDRVRQQQKNYVLRKRDRAALPEVATQPVEQAVQAPPIAQATACKLSECPSCGTRFYMVKPAAERTE